jgi:glycosyltransferase involved in cell wall biosynthesis
VARGNEILIVLHEPELGGATRAILRVVPLLEESGWRFAFWVPGEGDASAELARRGYDVAARRRLLPFSLGTLRQPPGPAARLAGVPPYVAAFARHLRALRPALVHGNTLLSLPELLVARVTRHRTLLYGHEMLPPGVKGAATVAVARAAASAVLTVSEASRRELAARSLRATVVYEGVPLPSAPAQKRSGHRLVVGMVGFLSARKGVDVFLAAVRHAARLAAEIEWRLVGPIVGGHRERWALEQLAEAARLGVRYEPRVEDVFAEIAGWDVFVLPSRRDPFPIALLEAMASGLPVVATAVDGISEQVTPTTGVLVPPEDPRALAAAILALAADGPRRERLGREARERVARLFPVERQAEGLDRAYRELVSRRGA